MNLRGGLSKAHGRYELKLTPMIDVVFLLLIFFMTTIKFRTPEGKIQSDLPQDTIEVTAAEAEQVQITARRKGDNTEIYVNEESFELNFDQVETRLRTLREKFERTKEPHIFIVDGSQDVEFQHVIWTINACIRAGIKDLSFAPPPTSAF